jgi:hypothetical protein
VEFWCFCELGDEVFESDARLLKDLARGWALVGFFVWRQQNSVIRTRQRRLARLEATKLRHSDTPKATRPRCLDPS